MGTPATVKHDGRMGVPAAVGDDGQMGTPAAVRDDGQMRAAEGNTHEATSTHLAVDQHRKPSILASLGSDGRDRPTP